MDEMGKWLAAVAMMALGAFLIILSLIIGFLNLLPVFSVGVALCGFGGFIYYLRDMSVKSHSRVKKLKTTRVVREVPKEEYIPKSAEVKVEKPREPEILCDTCQFYNENRKQRCKFLTELDRTSMINAGIQCVEYKIELSLLDED